MQQNIQLKDYTTMKLGGPAKYLATSNTKEELEKLVLQAGEMPVIALGQGSNIIVGENGFDGLVILNRIKGFEILDEDPSKVRVKIGAGEMWDEIVAKTTNMGLSGIECLSAIPGCVGAAPVQNIGAYGQEIADVLIELEAYDVKEKCFIKFSNSDCDFAYRSSIFNTGQEKRRYIIDSVSIELTKTVMEPPFYATLQQYLDKNNITEYSPPNIRQSVIAVRSLRLPDPKITPNCGSFFKNPIVEKWQAENIKNEYPDVKIFPMSENTVKISAGWLVKNSELSDPETTGFKIYPNNPLVITNTGEGTYEGLAKMRKTIIDAVRDKFRIILEQEPEEVGV